MWDGPTPLSEDELDPDWSVYLAQGEELVLVWADAGYLRLIGDSTEPGAVVGSPVSEVSALAATHVAALQSVRLTGEPQSGVDQVPSAEGGTTEFAWRAYSPLPDYVLVVVYRESPASAKVIAEHLERVAQAQVESALLIESQRQAAAAMKDYQERAASLLLRSQEDAAATARVLQLADLEDAPPEVRDRLLRTFHEAAEELRRLQGQSAQALRESQSAVAAILAEATELEAEAWPSSSADL